MIKETKYAHQIALTVQQVAEILGGISVSYVYRLIREKKLPSKKLGGRVLVPRKSLEDFLNTPDEPIDLEEDDEYTTSRLLPPGFFNLQ
jgi:excisionase family DNA binding protein